MAGLIAGIVGGIVVGSLSGSHISVSGPAAGLTTIVLNAINEMGAFDLFLSTVVAAGIIQFILGLLKAGVIGYYFPTSVIKGMLSAIGLILILKQIPHGLGYDKDYLGDLKFEQQDHENTFTEIVEAIQHPSPGAIVILVISLLILILFEQKKVKKHRLLGLVPGALVVVLLGVIINLLFGIYLPSFMLEHEHLVTIPVTASFSDLSGLIVFPDFSLIGTKQFWVVAITLSLVGSIETLLSIEASDKLDVEKRVTPASRELLAQGAGNTLSGLIGGLPVTAVIVRSSANAAAGAKTKMSAIFHGTLLLILVLSIPKLLNLIPLSCLAAVLFMVGYKLAKPSIFLAMYHKGWNQFLPFFITIVSILFTDLLVGIGIGMAVGLGFVIKTNFHKTVIITGLNRNYIVKLSGDVFFFNKAYLLKSLAAIPDHSNVIINANKVKFMDTDIMEILTDFIESAKHRNISVICEGLFDDETILKAD
jgi:MFS superfamily sulfate permease-like transporter